MAIGENLQRKKDLGEKIRELRKNAGLSLEKLGEKVGSKKGYMSELENGKVNPTVDYLTKVADALGCKVKDLFK